jgi:hypothetical protein
MKTITLAKLMLLSGAGVLAISTLAPGGTPGTSEPARDTRPIVQLTSFGVAELMPEGNPSVTAVHVRAVVTNTVTDRLIALDMSKARAELVQGSTVGPVFVNADLMTLPITIVAPTEQRVIDFYFPLPPELDRDNLTAFGFTWRMNVPSGAEAHAVLTSNDRGDPETAYAAGSGARWWSDPTYAWATYYHRSGRMLPRPPRYVTLTAPPSWGEVRVIDDDDARNHECEQW